MLLKWLCGKYDKEYVWKDSVAVGLSQNCGQMINLKALTKFLLPIWHLPIDLGVRIARIDKNPFVCCWALENLRIGHLFPIDFWSLCMFVFGLLHHKI